VLLQLATCTRWLHLDCLLLLLLLLLAAAVLLLVVPAGSAAAAAAGPATADSINPSCFITSCSWPKACSSAACQACHKPATLARLLAAGSMLIQTDSSAEWLRLLASIRSFMVASVLRQWLLKHGLTTTHLQEGRRAGRLVSTGNKAAG
jgi:hypothetical protein